MAQNNNTPVFYWLALPLTALGKWLQTNNQLVAEAERRRHHK